MQKTVVSPGRPSAATQAERHAMLVDVATDEFIAKGFEAASLDGIAKAAGVAKHTIYRNFGGKEGLLRAALLRGYGTFAEKLTDLLDASAEPARVLDKAARHITLSATGARGLALSRLVIAHKDKLPALDDVVNHLNDQLRYPLLRYFSALNERGTLRIGNVQIATVQFINLCTLGPYYLLDGDAEAVQRGETLEDIVVPAVRMFLAGYAA
ncbi:TetR/AcrR family transcriptional regulator [Silvimonas sp. JCM 19000]